ncbi:YiiX/YebB-like N1pC/P60 family cysteine hydrolase [Halobacteriovorax sp. JY17]|uniref:YiiX/YebB-like N1pC/P60 family cysteine hydrolase n=1 Tax=Halobacteriovorax sp. JY17 TaxID=2014617 RepID=UPI000C3A3F80|nr:YiiX/YebB-like N1pC/P60 family cysteine hydrolase [Halobacteriovorax sp. JY17]PIK16163.1 MAG: hypothetical protein CES88_05360 [Halobacteriovorax sp. JY17]
MKKYIFLRIILLVFLVRGSFASNQQLQRDIENPDKLYLESSRIIGEVNFETGSGEATFLENGNSFTRLSLLLKRVDNFSLHLAEKIKSTLSSGRVVNGEEVYQISTLLNIYHGISVKFNELNTYAKPDGLNTFLQTGDTIRFGKDLLWLATYTKLYMSFYNNYLNYYKHINLRKIVKNLVKTKRESGQIKIDELFVMISHVLEEDNRREVREYFKKYREYQQKYTRKGASIEEEVQFLFFQIEQDHIVEKILSNNLENISNYTFTDTLMEVFGKVTNAISGVFGNLVGKVRWRHGHFYKDSFVKEKLMSKLQPLDILFEKTPFALTDTFIPGHFGHAALYLGTEEQLKNLEMWETSLIKPYQDRIRKGETIIEAIRPGVGLTTLDRFLEIDEIAIVRQKSLIKDTFEMYEIYRRALDQIGKKYDFNFDVETTDKIVCSELLFFAFGKINWPTVYILGRPTISPDNLAELTFYDNSPLKFELNYWSKKRGTLIEGSIEDLAKNIGYEKSLLRSTPEQIAFNKKEYRCKTVITTKLRSGSRRSRHIQRRVCGVEYEKKVYNSAESFRDGHNGYFK